MRIFPQRLKPRSAPCVYGTAKAVPLQVLNVLWTSAPELAKLDLANSADPFMHIATIHEAKTNLSKLIEQAERGEEVIIARGKQPVVKLVPVETTPKKRPFGLYKGEFEVGPEFFEPLPDDELEAWYK